jgi:predicted GIY-YIG superfamily endonuclease
LPTAVAYRVYVIQNHEGKFYIGLSDDVARRLEEHNTGQSRWTKSAALGQLSGKAASYHFQKHENWKTV